MYRLAMGLSLALALSGGAIAQRPLQPTQLQPPPLPGGGMQPKKLTPPRVGPPSHRPENDEQEIPDFRELIFGTKKPNEKIDPELLKKLMEKMPKDKKVDQKQIEQMFEKNPELKNPDFLKQLEQMLKDKNFPQNLENQFPKNDGVPKINNGEDLSEKLKQIIENGNKPIDPKDVNAEINGPKNELTNPDGSPINPESPKSPYADNEWVKWFEKHFKDSATTNDAMKDLFNGLEKSGGKGFLDDIPEFKNGSFKDIDSWGKENAGDLWKTKPPEIGGTSFKGPNFGSGSGGSGGSSFGGGGGSSGGSSGFGGGSGASFDGGSSVLIVMAAAGAAIFLAFLFFRKWKQAQVERLHALATGPSPIDFDSIRSRGALVRVFNRVSLERCGDDAMNWNHRVIAGQFSEAQPALTEPADTVAELYERARYAPLNEDLTPPEFSDARRDLRTIAGVSS